MHIVVFVLTCLDLTSHGRRVQTPKERVQGWPSKDRRQPVQVTNVVSGSQSKEQVNDKVTEDPLKILAKLLPELNQAAAFNPSLGQGFRGGSALLQPIHHRSSDIQQPQISKQARQQIVHMMTAEEYDRHVVVVGAGWGGLGAAWRLSADSRTRVTIVDAGDRPGGLVADGFKTPGGRRAEAGIHGFWGCYHNIFALLDEVGLDRDDVLTGYAEQGQYSPRGLEAVWPVYRKDSSGQSRLKLPTGVGQAFLTRFLNLSPLELATALTMVAAFSEFDDSPEAWERFDRISFRDLCLKCGVSRRVYAEVFESMILTGLFAPGDQCSAAAALGMAYFFVLREQDAFDVRWCRGDIGATLLAPWIDKMLKRGNVEYRSGTRCTDILLEGQAGQKRAVGIQVTRNTLPGISAPEKEDIACDDVVLAVGMEALKAIATRAPGLAGVSSFARFANLRGTDVLATRLWLDREVDLPYTANACWGFDDRVGMTIFDIKRLHAPTHDKELGAVLEVDFYHAGSVLARGNDTAIIERAKAHVDSCFGDSARAATVIDAAVVRLPRAVNWYFPGSYASLPDVRANDLSNVFFAGDAVKTQHGSWSQEKALVTGYEAANLVLGRDRASSVIPLKEDEPHVAAGRTAVRTARSVFGSRTPSLADFAW